MSKHNEPKKKITADSFPKNLVVKSRYRTSIPPVPIEPKFLKFDFDPNRFIRYRPSQVESKYKFNILVDTRVNVPVDLIDLETYKAKTLKPSHKTGDDDMHIEDRKLFSLIDAALRSDTQAQKGGSKKALREQQHDLQVNWLRPPIYMSSEVQTFGKGVENKSCKTNSKTDRNNNDGDILSSILAKNGRLSKQDIIDEIDRGFNAIQTKTEFVHPNKPGVQCVSVTPLLPDVDNWGTMYTHVTFTLDPRPSKGNSNINKTINERDRLKLGLLHGVKSQDPKDTNQMFFSYFLPSHQVLLDRQERSNDETVEKQNEKYDYLRDYDFKISADGSKLDNFFLTNDGNTVYYNSINNKLSLDIRRPNKRTAIHKDTNITPEHEYIAPSGAIVNHRTFTRAELKQIKKRMKMLTDVEDDNDSDVYDDDDDELDNMSINSSEVDGSLEESPKDNENNNDRSFISNDDIDDDF